MKDKKKYKIDNYKDCQVLSILDLSKDNIINLINDLDIFKIKYDTIIINSACSDYERRIYQTIIENIKCNNLLDISCTFRATNYDIVEFREEFIAFHFREACEIEKELDKLDEEIINKGSVSFYNIVNNDNMDFTYRTIPKEAVDYIFKLFYINKRYDFYSYHNEINFRNILVLDSNYYFCKIPQMLREEDNKLISYNILPLINIYQYDKLSFIKLKIK